MMQMCVRVFSVADDAVLARRRLATGSKLARDLGKASYVTSVFGIVVVLAAAAVIIFLLSAVVSVVDNILPSNTNIN